MIAQSRALKILLSVFFFCSFAWAGEFIDPGDYKGSANDLQVIFIDVGQGDSALVRAPHGRNVLIDAGCEAEPGAGRQKTVAMLKKLNVRSLDYVILTHPHPDHGGGLKEIFEDFSVRNYRDNGGSSEVFDVNVIRALAGKKGINYRVLRRGENIELETGVKFEVLGPPPDEAVSGIYQQTSRWSTKARNKSSDKENNGSLVLRLDYGSLAVLFTGDAEMEEEKWLVKNCGAKLACDVIKSPHHGSRTSSSAVFLKKAAPKAAVISCGLNNPYGHPNPATISKLKRRNIIIYRTDRDGDVTLTSNGSEFKIETAKR